MTRSRPALWFDRIQTILALETTDCPDASHVLKLGIYARCTIPEVWLVDLKSGRITRYQGPADGNYRALDILNPGTPVAVPGLPSVSLDLAGLL